MRYFASLRRLSSVSRCGIFSLFRNSLSLGRLALAIVICIVISILLPYTAGAAQLALADASAKHTSDLRLKAELSKANRHAGSSVFIVHNNIKNNAPAARPFTSDSLLDEVGYLTRPVAPQALSSWKQELGLRTTTRQRLAQLHLWLGEYQLGQDSDPELAQAQFDLVKALSTTRDPLYGLATYDFTVASFYEGAYRDSADSFLDLISPQCHLTGYNRMNCARFYKHAVACADYHAERSRAGIPEPPVLDPRCGAAALATCLRTIHVPYDEQSVLKAMHVGGEGSDMQDLGDAVNKLGLRLHTFDADQPGLILAPKPLVAFVEDDHFIAVTGANKNGVTYLCSDCGAWPGGEVHLNWKQWKMLDATILVAVVEPGSYWDTVLTETQNLPIGKSLAATEAAAAVELKTLPRVQIASVGNIARIGHLSEVMPTAKLLTELRTHLVIQDYIDFAGHDGCGNKPGTMQCAPMVPCPMSCSSEGGGPSQGDPVNVATGEEEYSPPSDISVYNPLGPSVAWGRVYNSLRPAASNYESDDYGVGWSASYNIGVYDPEAGGAGTKYVVFPNGGRVQFNDSVVPTAANPSVPCQATFAGTPMILTWHFFSGVPSEPNLGYTYYTITFPDRSVIRTERITLTNGIDFSQPLSIADSLGNKLNFVYGLTAADGWPLVTSILNGASTTLLTINRAANGNITSIADCYSRSVYYTVGSIPEWPRAYQQLTAVSQIVPTGTGSPAGMYGYGYVSLNNGEAGEEVPFLNTITTPSPSGSGSSTATIYYGSNYFVTGTEDGNGQTVSYAPISGSPGTIVTVSGTGMPQPFSYTESFDSSMRLNWITNGADQPMLYYAYLSGTDVYKPSAESDSNGHTVKYTYDSFGNVITKTSPYGTETTNTYAYTDFALGELVSSEEGSKVATSFSYYEPSGLVQTINAPTPYGITTAQPTVPYNFYYDSLGDLTEVQTPGSTVGSTVTTTYTYGSSPQFGQVLSATDNLGHTKFFTYDDQANVTSATDARGYTTYYGNTSRTGGYNIADQNVLVTYPATGQTGTGNSQQVTTYEYTGGPVESVSATNEAGTTVRTVNYAYGAEGELLGVSGSAPTTTYSYDAMYRPLTVSDGKANVTHYYYNAQGFLDSVTYPGYSGAPAFSPSTGAWYVTGRDSVHYASYDPIGDPGTRVDGRGVVTSYLYSDPANQLTDVSYDVSGAPVASQSAVFLTYDNYGRLATIQNGLTKVQYGFYIGAQYYPGYDDSNRPLCQQVTYYNDESTLFSKDLVRYYNPDGSKSESVLYPYVGSTHYCTYTYDAAQRLASETNPFGQTTSYSYFDNNWLGGVTLEAPSTGPTTSYVPNPLGETTELINRDSNADGDAVGSDFSSIKHDGVGNQTGDSVVFNAYTPYSGSTSYTYDGLDELTDESSTRNSGYNLGFAFDSAQNATTYLNVGGRTFNSDNQLTGAGGSSYGYDGDGNLTSINSTAITYDVEDRMTAVPGSLTNGYGADGSRATSTDLAVGTVYYLYDWDSIAPAFEFSAGGSALAVNTYGLTGLTSRATAATTTYYEFDPQGNVCQRLDINGVTHNASITTGFGTVTNYAPPNDPFGYAAQSGGYTDQTTGLVAMGSRFYMSGIGRFLNRDPIGAAGGTNVYAYTNNNPVNNVDPSGLAKQQDDGGDWAVSMADSTVDPSSRALADIAVPGSCGRQLFSGLADSVAGVVTAPLKAITGQDLIAGTSISPGDRLLAVVMTALEFIPGAGEEAAATGFDRIALGRFNHYVGDGQYEDMLDGFAESHKATSYRNWGYEVEGDMMPSVRDAMSKAKQIYFNMSDIDQDRALSGNYANGAEQELVEILNNEELFDKTNFDYDYVP